MSAKGEYRELLEGLPDGFVRCRLLFDDGAPVDCLVVEANPALARILGLPLESVVGQRVSDLVPEMKRMGVSWLAPCLEAARSKEAVVISRLQHATGRWLELSVYGQEGDISVLFHDITEHARTSEALRRSEQRYRYLFEHSIDAVYVVSPDGDYIEANQAWLEMFRGTREDLAKARAIDFYADPSEREDFLKQMAKVGRVQDVVRLKRFDGTVFDCERRVVALKDEEGNLIGYQGLHRNVSAQLKMEQSLRESEANLRALLDATTDAACLMDPDGGIIALNEEMARRLRGTPVECIGKCVWDLLPHEVAPGRRAKLEEVVSSGLPTRFEDARDRRRILTSIWPIFDRHGHVVRLAVYGRDVTDERRVEQDLRESREELRLLAARQQEVREQERLGIARELHDQMGQDLTVLKMDLHRARKRLGDGAPVDAEGLTRMLCLVDRMARDVRRISSELRPGVLDDLGLVAAMEWQLAQFQSHTGISCRLEVDAEDMAMDRALSTSLFRVFQELLTNVARHARATHVRAGLTHDDARLILTVADDGKGISTEQQESHRSLGLIGIRERIRPYDGVLRYDSPASGGTVAHVVVPVPPAMANAGRQLEE